jgi:hypothetical protein
MFGCNHAIPLAKKYFIYITYSKSSPFICKEKGAPGAISQQKESKSFFWGPPLTPGAGGSSLYSIGKPLIGLVRPWYAATK